MSGAPVTALRAVAYKIPTDAPEADGTFAWEATTLVLVEVEGGGRTGLGYTYTDASAATLIGTTLAKAEEGALLGMLRDAVPIYGSGGFTTYTDERLGEQLAGWVERDGCAAVKMKIGAEAEDPRRMLVARRAIGDRAHLFIDANGALSEKAARHVAALARDLDVRWFEEPVSSDDLAGLSRLRGHVPAPMEVAAGEYVATLDDARSMLAAGAVDVQQADLTRCGGVTGFGQVAALCEAFHTDLSGHCAPAVHLHAACAAPRLRHLEWFHDHVRIEAMLFDGAPKPAGGAIKPDLSRPGHGLTFRAADAERYRVASHR